MKPIKLSVLAASIAVLSACGGGGGGSDAQASASTPPSSTSQSTPTGSTGSGTPNTSQPSPQPAAPVVPVVQPTRPQNENSPATQPAPSTGPAVPTTPAAQVQPTEPPPTTQPTVPSQPETPVTPPPAPAQPTQPTTPPVTPPVEQKPPVVVAPPVENPTANPPPLPAQPSPGQAAQMFLNSITNPAAPASRQTRDMPDQYNDPQIHVVYAVARGEADRGRDVSNYLTNSIQSWNNWLKVESDGRKVKFDVFQDRLDITFVQLPKTDQEYAAYGRNKIEVITADLDIALGGLRSNKKYMVYFEGGKQYGSDYVTCGDTKIGHPVMVHYLLGDPLGAICHQGRDFATSGTVEPRYLDYIMLHELIHSEGGVDDDAPNEQLNHVEGVGERDIMALTGNFDGWKILDVTKSNYFNNDGLPSNIANFANSRFLTPRGSVR